MERISRSAWRSDRFLASRYSVNEPHAPGLSSQETIRALRPGSPTHTTYPVRPRTVVVGVPDPGNPCCSTTDSNSATSKTEAPRQPEQVPADHSKTELRPSRLCFGEGRGSRCRSHGRRRGAKEAGWQYSGRAEVRRASGERLADGRSMSNTPAKTAPPSATNPRASAIAFLTPQRVRKRDLSCKTAGRSNLLPRPAGSRPCRLPPPWRPATRGTARLRRSRTD
jgi:hypothetical protein